MADGDEQFRLGVEHGFSDEPVYRWQDRFHQDRYDAGYLCGQTARRLQQGREQGPLEWDEFCRRMQRRGYDRDR